MNDARGLTTLSWVDRIGWWLSQRRQPEGDLELSQNRIYILPSKPGLLYASVLACMLIASMNYQLALGYGLTFLLGSVGLVTILHTFRNLNRLMLRPGRVEPVFAGQLAEFSLMMVNPTTLPRHAIGFIGEGMAVKHMVDSPAKAETVFTLALPTSQRGWMTAPRLRLSTTYPLGLWRAWSYWRPGMRVLVYPTPEGGGPGLPEGRVGVADGTSSGPGDEEIAGLRDYQEGDNPARIAWKAMARHPGENMLTKLMEGGARGDLALDWFTLPVQLDRELKIARLTRWVLQADSEGRRYGLRLPDQTLAPDHGPSHRAACLEALAVLPR